MRFVRWTGLRAEKGLSSLSLQVPACADAGYVFSG